MPKGKPSSERVTPASTSLNPLSSHPIDRAAESEPPGSSILLSSLSSQRNSRTPSPFVNIRNSKNKKPSPESQPLTKKADQSDSDSGFDDWNDDSDDDMPSELRPPFHRPTDGRSHTPLLAHKDEDDEGDYGSPPARPVLSRRSTFHERDPESEARHATKKRYTYAGGFLLLSLISFAIQTETAVYVQHNLGWEKPYCML